MSYKSRESPSYTHLGIQHILSEILSKLNLLKYFRFTCIKFVWLLHVQLQWYIYVNRYNMHILWTTRYYLCSGGATNSLSSSRASSRCSEVSEDAEPYAVRDTADNSRTTPSGPNSVGAKSRIPLSRNSSIRKPSYRWLPWQWTTLDTIRVERDLEEMTHHIWMYLLKNMFFVSHCSMWSVASHCDCLELSGPQLQVQQVFSCSPFLALLSFNIQITANNFTLLYQDHYSFSNLFKFVSNLSLIAVHFDDLHAFTSLCFY